MLRAWSDGNKAALDQLTPVVYSELHQIAHGYMRQQQPGQTLQTTALVNEAYLRLVNVEGVRWRDRTHFFAVAAQDERTKVGLTPKAAAQIPLPVFADQIIGSLVVSYRANAGLLRAMRQFVQVRAHTEFWNKASAVELRTLRRVVDLFLAHLR